MYESQHVYYKKMWLLNNKKQLALNAVIKKMDDE